VKLLRLFLTQGAVLAMCAKVVELKLKFTQWASPLLGEYRFAIVAFKARLESHLDSGLTSQRDP
jgi:hypothetical protein